MICSLKIISNYGVPVTSLFYFKKQDKLKFVPWQDCGKVSIVDVFRLDSTSTVLRRRAQRERYERITLD